MDIVEKYKAIEEKILLIKQSGGTLRNREGKKAQGEQRCLIASASDSDLEKLAFHLVQNSSWQDQSFKEILNILKERRKLLQTTPFYGKPPVPLKEEVKREGGYNKN